jgi:hypothetical protein
MTFENKLKDIFVKLLLWVFLSLTFQVLNEKNEGLKHKVNTTKHHSAMEHIQRRVLPSKLDFALSKLKYGGELL